MFTWVYRVFIGFFCNIYGKGSKNRRETLYSSKGKIVYVVGKPCNIYRLWGKPSVNYRISVRNHVKLIHVVTSPRGFSKGTVLCGGY